MGGSETLDRSRKLEVPGECEEEIVVNVGIVNDVRFGGHDRMERER